MLKVDCHVHSEYSKYIKATTSFLKIFGAKECYNKLEDIYRIAKERGMDYVAITDHDTIEGALILDDKYPDIIVGEELEVAVPDHGNFIHLVVLDIDEGIHDDLTDLKKVGIKATADYLKKRNIFYYIAHISHGVSDILLTPQLLDEMMQYVDILEVRNSETLPEENALTTILAELYNKKRVAGSDAHILDNIGQVFTVSDEATNKDEFIQALKLGDCYIRGHRGSNSAQLTRQAYKFICNIYKEIFLSPKQRQRHPVQKYFLDYLLLSILFAPILTYIPIYLISSNYQRVQRKRVLRLQKDFFVYYMDKS